ncbi:putative toxin-antitoxin system toxin component, PIN family [Kosmotoga olearia]|uniref:PilT protein domain protein n=1 Tax=Kosmotoga olearia (strain ATCC BAA-1733 / DSM 21960 / TBF 19.5.1) TaxID=521045 RepID=C5CDE4_KOSOT|nr:putative toxin-antitoxin system toxin component, PIN family [Kosmotoga olearia]ACR80007.1 PilT protein domain protein [Kosmotoga olearia TBF 19.5.1]
MKVVIDTNVLVSALLKPYSKPATILNMIIAGQIVPCFDARIFNEYEHVLLRKKFGFDPSLVEIFLRYLKRHGIFVTPKPLDPVLPDPYDLPFYEVAASAGAVIITGNKKHFPVDDVEVFSPDEFLRRE